MVKTIHTMFEWNLNIVFREECFKIYIKKYNKQEIHNGIMDGFYSAFEVHVKITWSLAYQHRRSIKLLFSIVLIHSFARVLAIAVWSTVSLKVGKFCLPEKKVSWNSIRMHVFYKDLNNTDKKLQYTVKKMSRRHPADYALCKKLFSFFIHFLWI